MILRDVVLGAGGEGILIQDGCSGEAILSSTCGKQMDE